MQVEILGYNKCSCEKSAQCSAAVKKSYARVIKKDSKTENSIELTYISTIYLHPEFWGQFWSPALRENTVELEKVPRKITRIIKYVEWLPYKI